MNILFVHNNFPAQYRRLLPHLIRRPDVRLAAIGSETAREIEGVKLLKYAFKDQNVSATHPFARRFDVECRRAEQVLYSLSYLRSSGFEPDLIMAHPGWGETLPLRTFFPKARLWIYCEFFYGVDGRDVDFDPEFTVKGLDNHVGLHAKNAATLLALAECDRAMSPTRWQRSTFPAAFQDRIDVIHEGIDTDLVAPANDAALRLPDGRTLTRDDEIVTFVCRNLEPLRGYHVFMRALPALLKKRPDAQVVIIGGDGTSYGAQPPRGATWKSIFLEEVKDRLDMRRVHFLGNVPYDVFLSALRVSSAHVYLTYPFVLSWSMLEAMSAGCVVVGSDTAPVREIIDGKNGLLVPFFDIDGIAETVADVLARPARFHPMRAAARKHIVENYNVKAAIAKMLEMIDTEAKG